MQYTFLGNSNLKISKLIYGAFVVGGWWWGGSEEKISINAIHKAIDRGINCIDTAPTYGFGRSENIIGKAIKKKRERIIIATKCGMVWNSKEGKFAKEIVDLDGKSYLVYNNLKPGSLLKECESSLKRLGVDTIDLYQIHYPDSTTPLEETMEALSKLKQQGKIREIGVSNFTLDLLKESIKYINIVSIQPEYSLLIRHIEKDIIPFCIENQVGIICYRPLAAGLLTGKFNEEYHYKEGDRRKEKQWFQQENLKKLNIVLNKVKKIADDKNASLSEIILNWTISQPGITAAIVGMRSPEQVEVNYRASDIILKDDELKYITDAFEPLKDLYTF